MKNILESGFIYESIHKIIKIQYYAKITVFTRLIIYLVNLVEIKHNIEF